MKIIFAISLLGEGAAKFATVPTNENRTLAAATTWQEFEEIIRVTFKDLDRIETARWKLCVLRQTKAVSEYHGPFFEYLALFDYTDEIQKNLFIKGLKPEIAKQLLISEEISCKIYNLKKLFMLSFVLAILIELSRL